MDQTQNVILRGGGDAEHKALFGPLDGKSVSIRLTDAHASTIEKTKMALILRNLAAMTTGMLFRYQYTEEEEENREARQPKRLLRTVVILNFYHAVFFVSVHAYVCACVQGQLFLSRHLNCSFTCSNSHPPLLSPKTSKSKFFISNSSSSDLQSR